MLGIVGLGGDQGGVHVGHVGTAVAVTAVWSQLAHQFAVNCGPPTHCHRHPHGRTRGNVLEGSAVAPVVLVAEVSAAGVVAGAGAAVLGGGLVTLAAHGLRIAVS